MQATSLLLGVAFIVGVYGVLPASSSCDPFKIRLACKKLLFRRFNGTCNNLCITERGAAGRPLRRFPALSPNFNAFESGFQPRSKSFAAGEYLPNARNVSRIVFRNTNADVNQTAPDFTHVTMTWGQFLDHDVTLTELIPEVDCGVNNKPCPIDPRCIGINITEWDMLAFNQSAQCIPLRRSLIKDGEQVNIITSYIDGSQVYGSDDELAERLRDPNDRKLLDTRPFVTSLGGHSLLPEADEEAFCRSPNTKDKPCFIAGDVRVNENQALMAMHTLWVREHNRIANHLHKLNPKWLDDKVFQETRKIVIAELQHITYNEWLPVLFDQSVRDKAHITLETDGMFFNGYDPRVNPEMFNSFATAALRMGHTLVRNFFQLLSNPKFKRSSRLLSRGFIPTREFFNPALLFLGRKINFIGEILAGLVTVRAQQIDGNFVDDLREQLIIEGNIVGDLPAINIQRGRDHGLPSYVKFREACGGGVVKSFDDLQDIISKEQRDRLNRAYRGTVQDIDLFAGGISEFPAPGSVLGPTFTCIITQQFKNVRFGDRFWYERKTNNVPRFKIFIYPNMAFTLPQLTEIRKSSLARVMCDNTDSVFFIQEKVFLPRNFKGANPVVDCDFLKKVNLDEFKEGNSAAMA